MNTNPVQFQSKLVSPTIWKVAHKGWMVINGIFLIYLLLSFSGLFHTLFPRLIKLFDSELFLRTVAISSLFLSTLIYIFRRKLLSLLATIEGNYYDIVRQANTTTSHWAFDNFTRIDALLRFTTIFISTLLVYFALTDSQYYFFWIQEDSIVETNSALIWFAALLTTLVTIFLGYGKGINLTFYILLALFFFACGGEEISWGQRLYQIETPQLWAEINVQKETTLHNIGSTSLFSNAFFLITLTFFLLIPWLQRYIPGFTCYITHFGLPMVRRGAVFIYLVTLVAWVIVGLRYGTLGFHPFTLWDYYRQLDDELFEYMAALSFFAFAALNLEGKIRS